MKIVFDENRWKSLKIGKSTIVLFKSTIQNLMLPIQFFTILYGLIFIDFLMVIGRTKKNIKEFRYVSVVTTILEIVLLSQQICFTFYQCLQFSTCHGRWEEMTNLAFFVLFICSSLCLFLEMKILNNEEDNYDMNSKCRRYSV